MTACVIPANRIAILGNGGKDPGGEISGFTMSGARDNKWDPG